MRGGSGGTKNPYIGNCQNTSLYSDITIYIIPIIPKEISAPIVWYTSGKFEKTSRSVLYYKKAKVTSLAQMPHFSTSLSSTIFLVFVSGA